MTKFVVFLRGINVGGRIIKMAELKACLEAVGFSEVKTWLQTGNVTFEAKETDAKKLKDQIEAALTQTFGYPAKVQVFTMEQLRHIVENCPFADSVEGKHSYVIFLENGLEKELAEETATLEGEQIQQGKSVIYWQVDKGNTLKSTFAKHLTKAKYKNFNTNRNINTLRKMLA